MNRAGLRYSSYTPRKHPLRTVPLSHFPSRWLFYPDAHISPVHFTQFLSCELLGEVCPGHLNKFLLSPVPSSSLKSWLPAWHCIADPHYSWILLCVNLLTCRNVLVNPRSRGHQQCRKYESPGIQISHRGLTRALRFLVSAPLLLTVSLPHCIWHHISSIANVFVLKVIVGTVQRGCAVLLSTVKL